MPHTRRVVSRKQEGVALAIVVWFIAGMSLLVAGIVAQARVDTQLAQNHLSRALVAAAGDGAINLMMAEVVSANDPAMRAETMPVGGEYRVGNTNTIVFLVPASGLIDIESAPASMLSALFVAVGRLDPEEAGVVAQNVVKARGARTVQGLADPVAKVEVMEDLLRIEGFSRSLLDAVRDFVVVGDAGQGDVNWMEAPEGMLDILAETNQARADAVRDRRGSAADRGRQMANAYRVDALVERGDRLWLRRRWIMMTSAESSNLPWRVVRTEPPRVVARENYSLNGSADA